MQSAAAVAKSVAAIAKAWLPTPQNPDKRGLRMDRMLGLEWHETKFDSRPANPALVNFLE
jgi:hypothetical protein